ncbi:hypothetical protein Hanom_Chr10g00943411 [Helianthus anomalus]
MLVVERIKEKKKGKLAFRKTLYHMKEKDGGECRGVEAECVYGKVAKRHRTGF